MGLGELWSKLVYTLDVTIGCLPRGEQNRQKQKRNAGVSPLRYAPVEMTASVGRLSKTSKCNGRCGISGSRKARGGISAGPFYICNYFGYWLKFGSSSSSMP